MLLATLLVITGIVIASTLARFRAAWVPATIVVPLLAIYTLRTAALLPLFGLGVGLAYIGIRQARQEYFLYGTRLRVFAVLLGAVPTGVAIIGGLRFPDVLLAASALPGLAGMYLHELPTAERRDTVLMVGTSVLALSGVGAIIVWASFTPPCSTCGLIPWAVFPTVLLDRGIDAAAILGLGRPGTPLSLDPFAGVIAVVVFAVAVIETLDTFWGMTALGVVELPVLVVLALHDQFTLIAFAVVLVVNYFLLQLIHTRTFLVGGPLLPTAVTFGAVLVLGPALFLPSSEGHSMFVAGLVAAVSAYRLHTIGPPDRAAAAIVAAGSFVVTFSGARILLIPFESGLGAEYAPAHLIVGAVVVGAASWVLIETRASLVARYPRRSSFSEEQR